jgi:hypothetical protein
MKVSLTPQYRILMVALLPTTLGIGTVALWLRSLNWPCHVDEEGVTLRYRRRVPWSLINKVGTWRDYRDGHLSRIDIHHRGRVSRIPIHALQDGEEVARAILDSFKLARRRHTMAASARGRANPFEWPTPLQGRLQ